MHIKKIHIYVGRINESDGIADLERDFPAAAAEQFNHDEIAAEVRKVCLIGKGEFILHLDAEKVGQDQLQRSLRQIFPQFNIEGMAEVVTSKNSDVSLMRHGAINNPCNIFGAMTNDAMNRFGRWSPVKSPAVQAAEFTADA